LKLLYQPDWNTQKDWNHTYFQSNEEKKLWDERRFWRIKYPLFRIGAFVFEEWFVSVFSRDENLREGLPELLLFSFVSR